MSGRVTMKNWSGKLENGQQESEEEKCRLRRKRKDDHLAFYLRRIRVLGLEAHASSA